VRTAPDVVLTGRFELPDRQRYVHLPIEVPRGVRQIHVRYSYNDQIDSDPLLTGGNTLDIGMFDERGIAPGSPGYRGWSGSEKLEFTVDAEWATPPYRPGPIGAGTWHVMLGPYKIAPQGLEYRVEITFNAGLPRQERVTMRTGTPTRPAMSRAAEPGWIRGDLHCHTLYSDGDSWPSEMLHAAAESGLEFLGVTDHNSVAHHPEYGAGGGVLPIVVPGVEVTTYHGHWNAWGTDRWYEFREPTAEGVSAAMREAIAAGAFVSVCHPKPFGPPWDYEEVRGFPAIEVWNGPWERANSASLAFWQARLDAGERIVALGGSDTHQLRAPHYAKLGLPTTWVRVGERHDAAAILGALRSGDSFVSASPAGPQLYLERRGDDAVVRSVGAAGALVALIADGVVAAGTAVATRDDEALLRIPRDARYVRAQLVDARGNVLAVTNPLWSRDSR
jgi:hypothetical protein